MEAYGELVKVFTRLHRFGHLSAIANWDAMVNMPAKGAEARGAALAELDVLMHSVITDKALAGRLATAKAACATLLSTVEQANLREMDRAWVKANKLPASLVERATLASNQSEQAWRKMRAANDWAGFVPFFKEVLDVAKETGACLAKDTDLLPYEALMEQYEPGMRVATLDAAFDNIQGWLPELIQKVMATAAAADAAPGAAPPLVEPVGPFPVDQQKALGVECMKMWQFDFDAGRLDVSSHPFCGGVPEDIRLTTRYRVDNFDQSLMGTIHETGHAKYEQNRGPRALLTQPVSMARSTGIHESQSLFAEMQIGRSEAFMTFLSGKLQQCFRNGGGGDASASADANNAKAFTPENLKRLYRRVRPGLIRVDADELCYPLHVALRYEIEKGLFNGTIQVEDIPAVWSAKMTRYFGLSTEGNYKDGCMQDIHWSLGMFGYFPTYTLGAMYAAQLMSAMRSELSHEAVDAGIANGDLTAVLAWQKAKVWSLGSSLSTDALMTAATGEPLNVLYYRKHLVSRYSEGMR